jgi:hypothetical protein
MTGIGPPILKVDKLMSRIAVMTLGLFFIVVASGWTADPSTAEAKAIAEIKKLGGEVTFEAVSVVNNGMRR